MSRGFPASGCASAHAGPGLKPVDQMGLGAGGAGAGTSAKCLHPFLFFLLGKGGSWQRLWGCPRAEEPHTPMTLNFGLFLCLVGRIRPPSASAMWPKLSV